MTFGLILFLWMAAPQRTYIGDSQAVPNSDVIPPQVLTYSEPFYTRAARTDGIEGIVTVEAEFDLKGNMTILRTVRSVGYGLDEMALAALRTWKFSPGLRNGVPVRTIARIDIEFKLANSPAEFDDVSRVGAGVSMPTVLKRVTPEYTPEARAARISGTVVLQVVIQADGAPKIVKVIKPLDLGLTENAIAALEQWKFNPAMRNGKEVPVSANIEVNFNLEKRKN